MLPHATENPFFVLDASAWVSRLVSQDEFHAAVKSWMEEQREAGVQFISPALLLAEVGGAISRHTGEPRLGKKAITQLENLPGLRLVEMDNELVLRRRNWLQNLVCEGLTPCTLQSPASWTCRWSPSMLTSTSAPGNG
jgi:predicted nucleic acid-binding protein